MLPYCVTIGDDDEENAHDGKWNARSFLQENQGISEKAAKPNCGHKSPMEEKRSRVIPKQMTGVAVNSVFASDQQPEHARKTIEKQNYRDQPVQFRQSSIAKYLNVGGRLVRV